MNDPFNLQRFILAQETSFSKALNEIKTGRKTTHWMWFIFPQLAGLGSSEMSKFYGIKDLDEAKAYLEHEILGKRLIKITEALLEIENKNIKEIMGKPDDLKLKSCMTLFSETGRDNAVFEKVLEKYFFGEKDNKTLVILNK